MAYYLNDEYWVKETPIGAKIYAPTDPLSPERADPYSGSVVLDDQAQWNLIQYLTDGLCPICGDEIPLNDIICDDCLGTAIAARIRKKGTVGWQ